MMIGMVGDSLLLQLLPVLLQIIAHTLEQAIVCERAFSHLPLNALSLRAAALGTTTPPRTVAVGRRARLVRVRCWMTLERRMVVIELTFFVMHLLHFLDFFNLLDFLYLGGSWLWSGLCGRWCRRWRWTCWRSGFWWLRL